MNVDKVKEIALKHALKNMHDYGKVSLQAVIGKVIAELPDVKKDMKNAMPIIRSVVDEVSKYDKQKVEEEMKKFSYVKPKKEEDKFAVEHQDHVKTRFPPEPSGYLHIGHAKAVWIARTIADKYGGEMQLRFDDTNPEKSKAEFVEHIKKDLEWLGVGWDHMSYTSDNIEEMIAKAEDLIKKGRAYVCTCAADQIKKNRLKKQECECREKNSLDLWKDMLEGEPYILRFKGDMRSENTTLRDPTLFRVINHPHYRLGEKYKAWPTYDFATVFMDHKEGITHVIRTKEYELRDELYRRLCEAMGYATPYLITMARLSIKGSAVGKRIIRPLVEQGKVDGWCDVRLPTICGLRKRGMLPEAIKEFVLSFGLTKIESQPSWDKLLAYNRKYLDPIAPHFFFVPEPRKFKIRGLSTDEKKMYQQPKTKEGVRHRKLGGEVYLPSQDMKSMKIGQRFRLKDLCTVEMVGEDELAVVEDQQTGKIVQWVFDQEVVAAKIYKPGDLLIDGEYNPKSMEIIEGVVEHAVNQRSADVVQFERFGFCRVFEDGNKVSAYWTC